MAGAAVSPDPAVPFQLMLFEDDPDQKDGDWEFEDLIQLEPVGYLQPLEDSGRSAQRKAPDPMLASLSRPGRSTS